MTLLYFFGNAKCSNHFGKIILCYLKKIRTCHILWSSKSISRYISYRNLAYIKQNFFILIGRIGIIVKNSKKTKLSSDNKLTKLWCTYTVGRTQHYKWRSQRWKHHRGYTMYFISIFRILSSTVSSPEFPVYCRFCYS